MTWNKCKKGTCCVAFWCGLVCVCVETVVRMCVLWCVWCVVFVCGVLFFCVCACGVVCCVVWCVVLVLCVCCVGCVCVCVWCGGACGVVVWCVVKLGTRKTPLCVRSKRLRVYGQDVSVCTGNKPACVRHAGLLLVHTETS